MPNAERRRGGTAQSLRGDVLILGCALGLLASACGGDDGDAGGAGGAGGAAGAGAGGTGGGAGAPAAGTTGPAPIVPLGDDIAGKACASNADCGTGTCATQITGLVLPADAPGGYCTNECMSDTDCGAGGACVGALANVLRGQCFATCSAEADCRDAYLCSDSFMLAGLTVPSTCRPKPPTDQLGDGVAGATCAADTDCSGGRCLTMRAGLTQTTALPGGYCTGSCLENSQCGAGGVCALTGVQGLAGGCYQSCGSDADCTREGYRCREVATDVRGCDAFPAPLPANSAGKACAADADCGGEMGSCASALPVSGFGGAVGQTIPAPGGYCTQRCADDADCGAGGVCARSALGTGRCYQPCATATDCREEYVCEERGGGGATMGDAGAAPGTLVCVPAPAPAGDAGMPAAEGGASG